MELNCLIVDDEPLALDLMEEFRPCLADRFGCPLLECFGGVAGVTRRGGGSDLPRYPDA